MHVLHDSSPWLWYECAFSYIHCIIKIIVSTSPFYIWKQLLLLSIFSSDCFLFVSFPQNQLIFYDLGLPRASLYVKCVGTVRAASHPPVWIHRKCELRSLKKMLNCLCWDDDYTIAQWLEHRWLQARVPGSSPGGDRQCFLQTFPVCLIPSKPVNLIIIIAM